MAVSARGGGAQGGGALGATLRCKCVVVGEAACGKTALCKAFKSQVRG